MSEIGHYMDKVREQAARIRELEAEVERMRKWNTLLKLEADKSLDRAAAAVRTEPLEVDWQDDPSIVLTNVRFALADAILKLKEQV